VAHPFHAFWAEHYAARHEQLLTEAAERRAAAFIDAPTDLLGITVRPLTIADAITLESAGVAPIAGGPVEAHSIFRLVWWQSLIGRPESLRNSFWRLLLGVYLCRFDGELAEAAVREWVGRHFADAPFSGSGEEGRPLGTSWVAPLVIEIAATTGWAEAEILRMRVDRLWQYRHAMTRRQDPKRYQYEPGDELLSEAMADFNRRQEQGSVPA
jgi:hypothetical protein